MVEMHMLHLKFMNTTIIGDANVSDIRSLSWRERLFSWPWRPWISYKHESYAFTVLHPDGARTVYVSLKTFFWFKDRELRRRELESYLMKIDKPESYLSRWDS
jgi:hypothetical protein